VDTEIQREIQWIKGRMEKLEKQNAGLRAELELLTEELRKKKILSQTVRS
jgi:hypothetical protein